MVHHTAGNYCTKWSCVCVCVCGWVGLRVLTPSPWDVVPPPPPGGFSCTSSQRLTSAQVPQCFTWLAWSARDFPCMMFSIVILLIVVSLNKKLYSHCSSLCIKLLCRYGPEVATRKAERSMGTWWPITRKFFPGKIRHCWLETQALQFFTELLWLSDNS